MISTLDLFACFFALLGIAIIAGGLYALARWGRREKKTTENR